MKNLRCILPLLILASLAFIFMPSGGWYQQNLPVIGNANVKDIYFLDSLKGFLTTSINSSSQSFLLKTTNGGDNWTTSFSFNNNKILQRVIFLDSQIGFINEGYNQLLKTTNGGNSWDSLSLPSDLYSDDMFVLNKDTLWLAFSNSIVGGVFRTIDGGINWTQQMNAGAGNPNKIYMVNKDTGYAADGTRFRRTTNSGLNWTLISGQDGFTDMKFINNSTGWKCNGTIKKTTDGGSTWVLQYTPGGSSVSLSDINKIAVLNKDTIWGIGGIYRYPSLIERGLIYKTTNGGANWGYQVPDSSIHINKYYHISATDKDHIWAYAFGLYGVHTKVGGNDTTFFTGIEQLSSEIPNNFKLYQNYPNPFNPKTVISYQLSIINFVRLTVFDITGKEVSVLINEKQPPGTYQYTFDGSTLSSGIYFYKLETEKFTDVKKMLLIK